MLENANTCTPLAKLRTATSTTTLREQRRLMHLALIKTGRLRRLLIFFWVRIPRLQIAQIEQCSVAPQHNTEATTCNAL